MMHKNYHCDFFFKSHESYLCVLSLQKELSALHVSLAHQQATQVDTKDSTDHQV